MKLSAAVSILAVLLIADCCYAFCPRPSTLVSTPSSSLDTLKKTTRLQVSVPEIVGVLVAGFAGWLYIDGADDRNRSKARQEQDALLQAYQDERARQAYLEPKPFWTEEELAPYNGKQDNDGPILLAADGLVFNVYKGRNFYGPGGEYHMFAGRDATRLLAKTSTEEETAEEAQKPLTVGERAALAGWMFTLKNKYEIVGELEGFDPSTTSLKEGVQSSWIDPRLE